MPRTLLVSGSLSAQAVQRLLDSPEAAGMTVLEMDRPFDRGRHPEVGGWLDGSAFLPRAEASAINRAADRLIDTFLSRDPGGVPVPTGRAFRAACLSSHAWRLAVPCLTNLHLAQRALAAGRFDRLVVAAGCGTHWAAWREFAERRGLPVRFLPVETTAPGLRRRAWKAWHRWRKPPLVRLEAPLDRSRQQAPEQSILCTSERLARLLAADPAALELPLLTLPAAAPADGAELAAKSAAYRRWWQRWQDEILHRDEELQNTEGAAAILTAIGSQSAQGIYPRQACLYEQARRQLQETRPRLLLCDTQAGTAERMWSLAAQELGIAVAAYVYDQMPNPRFSFQPDFLLSDSGRAAEIARFRGVPEAAIMPIRSHRQARLPRPQPAGARPLILYADSYYAGTNANNHPLTGYRCYQQVVEAARQLPQADFAIKFHPLREKKQEALSFVALDETELANRRAFIRGLRPPANLRLLEPEVSMLDLLPRVSVLLNLNSTAALEGFQMGIPVLFLRAPTADSQSYPHVHEFQAAMTAEDAASLSLALQKLLGDPAGLEDQIRRQRRYLEEFYWPPGPTLPEGLRRCLERLAATA